MKRDFDLIRDLLFQLENGGRSLESYEAFELGKRSVEEAGHALVLMHDRGLVKALRSPEFTSSEFYTFYDISMTWEGYDFLDSVRDPEIWKKTKEGALAAGGFTFDLVKALAKGFAKTKIQQHTGIELDL